MNSADEAHTIAAEFNARHSDVQLKVIRIANDVSMDELLAFVAQAPRPGEWLARNVFVQIRGREPAHGEAIAIGRLLARTGCPVTKYGNTSLYQLDKLRAAAAD